MQQLTLIGPNQFEWWDVPEPQLQSDQEAIVRPIANSRCDFDVAVIAGHPFFPFPTAFGHESISEVLEVGDDVQSVERGDLVVTPFQISCGSCPSCRSKVTAACTGNQPRALYGHNTSLLFCTDSDWGGHLSDKVRIPYTDHMLSKVNPGIDPTHLASISDNLSDAWRCVGQYAERYADINVLVVAGRSASIGLYSVLMAKALGVEQIDYFDHDQTRLDHAARLGANVLTGVMPTQLGPYRVTVNTSGQQEGLTLALNSTARGGVCTSTIVVAGGEVTIPLQYMYLNSVTLNTGFINDVVEIPKVIDLIHSGVLKPELVTTHLDDWDNAHEAFLVAGSKVIVHRDRETS